MRGEKGGHVIYRWKANDELIQNRNINRVFFVVTSLVTSYGPAMYLDIDMDGDRRPQTVFKLLFDVSSKP